MQRITIVGAGLAGHRAATGLRRAGFAGQLTIVGDEEHRPYDRPPLSKAVLAGAMEPERLFFACDDLGDVDWRLGRAARSLDLDRGTVTLDDDAEVAYDGLVIASGRRAARLPMTEGLAGCHVIRSLDDSGALRSAIRPDAAVVIVGAGFIGCETAATLRGLGVERVTVVDVAPHPMPVIGAELGAIAAGLHRERGVDLRLGVGLAAVEGDGRVEAVLLEDGTRLEADLLLVAVGSRPNSEWLEGSGLVLHRGAVLCDEHCLAVGSEVVAAAGDVAAWPHPAGGGEPAIVEHWSNAREMGDLAARNLLAGPDDREPHVALPSFWSDQFDVKIKSVGFLGLADRFELVHEDPGKPSYAAEAWRGEELVGAIAFNRPRTVLEYQRRLTAEVPA